MVTKQKKWQAWFRLMTMLGAEHLVHRKKLIKAYLYFA